MATAPLVAQAALLSGRKACGSAPALSPPALPAHGTLPIAACLAEAGKRVRYLVRAKKKILLFSLRDSVSKKGLAREGTRRAMSGFGGFGGFGAAAGGGFGGFGQQQQQPAACPLWQEGRPGSCRYGARCWCVPSLPYMHARTQTVRGVHSVRRCWTAHYALRAAWSESGPDRSRASCVQFCALGGSAPDRPAWVESTRQQQCGRRAARGGRLRRLRAVDGRRVRGGGPATHRLPRQWSSLVEAPRHVWVRAGPHLTLDRAMFVARQPRRGSP